MIARRFAPASLHRGHSIPAESAAMNVHHRNLVGPEIRKLRRQLGWTQDKLAKGLRREGLNVSRSAVAKIECASPALPICRTAMPGLRILQ